MLFLIENRMGRRGISPQFQRRVTDWLELASASPTPRKTSDQRADDLDLVRAGNAFDCGVAPVGVRDATVVWGSGRVEAEVLVVGLAVVGVVQAAWRYSLMSPLQVGCRRIGWPA